MLLFSKSYAFAIQDTLNMSYEHNI